MDDQRFFRFDRDPGMVHLWTGPLGVHLGVRPLWFRFDWCSKWSEVP